MSISEPRASQIWAMVSRVGEWQLHGLRMQPRFALCRRARRRRNEVTASAARMRPSSDLETEWCKAHTLRLESDSSDSPFVQRIQLLSVARRWGRGRALRTGDHSTLSLPATNAERLCWEQRDEAIQPFVCKRRREQHLSIARFHSVRCVKLSGRGTSITSRGLSYLTEE